MTGITLAVPAAGDPDEVAEAGAADGVVDEHAATTRANNASRTVAIDRGTRRA
jgi:hypothetical protein